MADFGSSSKARIIGIERQKDPCRPQMHQLFDVVLPKCGALSCHCIVKSRMDESQAIDLPLNNNRLRLLGDSTAAITQSEQHSRFFEKQRLGCIDVLSAKSFLFKFTRGKANHSPQWIAYRKSNPIGKKIAPSPLLCDYHQTSFHLNLFINAALLQIMHQHILMIGSKPYLKSTDKIEIEASVVEV